MNILFKLLNYPYRYRRTARRFNNGGITQRILYMLFMIVLISVALICLNLSLNMLLVDSQLGAIFLIIFVCCFLLAFVEMCIVYSIYSFKMAVSGSISNRYVENNEQASQRKCPKWLDILFGFIYLLLIVGMFIISYLLFTTK